VRFYLLAIAMECGWFAETSARSGLQLAAATVSRLVAALCEIKAFSQAVVLLQMMAGGYAAAARIIHDDPMALDPLYFRYLWDISFLELLVYVFAKLKDDAKTNSLVQMVGTPELNENNLFEIRQAFIAQMKINLLKALCQEFLLI